MKIKSILEESHIRLENLIGFGADNVSVMMGHLTGVRARLKEILPDIFVMGCTCHSFHLCSSAENGDDSDFVFINE